MCLNILGGFCYCCCFNRNWKYISCILWKDTHLPKQEARDCSDFTKARKNLFSSIFYPKLAPNFSNYKDFIIHSKAFHHSWL